MLFFAAFSLLESGVSAIIGPFGSTAVKASHSISAAYHIPQIAPTATSPVLFQSAMDYPFLLKVCILCYWVGQSDVTVMIS